MQLSLSLRHVINNESRFLKKDMIKSDEIALWHWIFNLMSNSVQQGNEKAAELLSQISALAILHINLGEIYHYDLDKAGIDMESILVALNDTLEAMLADAQKSKQKWGWICTNGAKTALYVQLLFK